MIVSVDDEPDISKLIQVTLKQEGLDVTTFNDQDPALEYIESNYNDISLILVDFHMPMMDGLEFIDEVNNLLTGKKVIPFGLVTSEKSLNVRLEAFTKGSVRYVEKPINQEKFVQDVREIIENVD